jgi:hypothetical protein
MYIYTPRLARVWPKDLQCSTINHYITLHLGEMENMGLKINMQDSIDVDT